MNDLLANVFAGEVLKVYDAVEQLTRQSVAWAPDQTEDLKHAQEILFRVRVAVESAERTQA